MQYRMFMYAATNKAWRQLGMSADDKDKYGYKPQVVWYNYTAGNNKVLFFFDAYKDPCHVGNKYIEATYISRENVVNVDVYGLESHKTYSN